LFANGGVFTLLREVRPDRVDKGLDLDLFPDSKCRTGGIGATWDVREKALFVGRLGSRARSLSTGINSGIGAGTAPLPISCRESTPKAY
jgi:hypothetical protein